MLQFKEWLVSTINADTTLQGFLKDANGNMNVFPVDVDLEPEQFPTITYADAGTTVLSIPKGLHVGIVQLDIWSTKDAYETEQIYDRLQAVLNFQHSSIASQTISGTLWWMRENGARDLHTPARRIWRKSMDIKVWTSKSDSS